MASFICPRFIFAPVSLLTLLARQFFLTLNYLCIVRVSQHCYSLPAIRVRRDKIAIARQNTRRYKILQLYSVEQEMSET